MKQTQNTNARQLLDKWTAFAKPEKGCYEGQDAPYTIRCGDRAIATVRQQVGAKANANLMAAAPELLEALEGVLHWLWETGVEIPTVQGEPSCEELAARAAIAKARGLDT